MLERGHSDYLVRTNETQREFRDYKIRVRNGLGLGVHIVPDMPLDLRERMITETTTNIINLCEELNGIPLPHIGIKSAEEEERLIKIANTPGTYPLAMTQVTAEHPEGVIEFSSKYLTHIVNFRMGRAETDPKPLELVTAHEVFHLWQHSGELTRQLIASDYARFEQEGVFGWNDTQTEKDASEFASRWLEKLHNPYR